MCWRRSAAASYTAHGTPHVMIRSTMFQTVVPLQLSFKFHVLQLLIPWFPCPPPHPSKATRSGASKWPGTPQQHTIAAAALATIPRPRCVQATPLHAASDTRWLTNVCFRGRVPRMWHQCVEAVAMCCTHPHLITPLEMALSAYQLLQCHSRLMRVRSSPALFAAQHCTA